MSKRGNKRKTGRKNKNQSEDGDYLPDMNRSPESEESGEYLRAPRKNPHKGKPPVPPEPQSTIKHQHSLQEK